MRRCGACNMPTPADKIGFSFAASSDDHAAHGVIGICRRCATAYRRLPAAVRFKTIGRAADRALANPDAYLCTVYPTIATARLATAMLGHPQHALATLGALGWMDCIDHAEKTP